MTFFDPRPTERRGTSRREMAPSLYSLAPKTVKPEEDDGGINFGLSEAFSLLSQGIPALARTLAPGSKPGEMGMAELGKGLVSGVAGTVGGGVIDIGDTLVNIFKPGADVDASGAFGRAVGRALGDEERYEARSPGQVAEEDGLLPALIQTIGDVSLVGGLATAPLRGAAGAARVGSAGSRAVRATGTADRLSNAATRLTGTADRIAANPAVRAIQHPYIEAGRATRSRFLAPAAERAAQAGRILPEDVEVPQPPKRADLEAQAADAGIDTAGLNRNQLWEAVDPDGFRAFDDARLKSRQAKGRDPVPPGSTPPVGRLTQAAAGLENRLVARDAARVVRQETRLADIARRAASRNSGVNAAIRTAREHLVQGAGLKPRAAKKIVENEIHARLEGHTLLEAEMPDVPKEVLRQVRVESGHGTGMLDEALDALPADARAALDADIDNAAQLTRAAKDEALQTLRSSRRGTEGLEDLDSTDARLTKSQEAKLRKARQLLQRAHGDVQARKVAREAASRKDYIAGQQDRLGRIATRARQIAEQKLDALADFDHARTWFRNTVWGSAAGLRRSAQSIYDATVANGSVTFDPHTGQGRFLVPGQDQGHSVGLVTGTAVKAAATPEIAAATGLPLFSPDLVTDVIRAYQDVYEHPNTVLGTWKKDGIVHIDPGEVLPDLDEALLRAGARAQEAVYDLGAAAEVSVPLQLRPDVAAQFLDRNSGYLKMAQRTRDLVGRTKLTHEDASRHMAMLSRLAVRAVEKGLIQHPDEFFGQVLKDMQFATRGSKKPGVLRQIASTIARDLGTPELRDQLMKDIEATGIDIEQAAHWYRDSHAWVEKTFRDKGDITLLNGRKINAADLFYQILAVTSTNNAPITNLPDALSGFKHLANEGTKLRSAVGDILGQVADGKMTLEQALDRMFGDSDALHPASGRHGDKSARSGKPGSKAKGVPTLPEHPLFKEIMGGKAVHHAEIAKEMVAEILMGNTMDAYPGWRGWTPEYMAERTAKLWGRHPKEFKIPEFDADGNRVIRRGRPATKPVSFEEARSWVEEQIPEAVAELGADRAVLEYFGSHLSAKPISFWDNLARPETSKAVTQDRWMQRLFGSDMQKPGEWLRFSNEVRAMADQFGLPAGEMQAVLWVYAFKMAGEDPLTAASFQRLMTDPMFRSTKKGQKTKFWERIESHEDVLDADRFLQQFGDKILGEFVPMPDEAAGIIRIFEDGNFGTLVHESGHLLRRMLDDAQMQSVERVYGVRGRKWDVKAEERFADDLLAWMNGANAPRGLETSFGRIREIMSTVWDYVARTFQSGRVSPEAAAVFGDWFDPVDQAMPAPGAAGILGLPAPSAATGTLRQQAARRPGFAEPPAKAEDFYQSGKKGAEALAKMERLEARRSTLEATRARVQKSIDEVQQVLDEDRLPSQLAKAGMEKDAARLIDQVYNQNKNPSLARTPAKWQPLMHAVRVIGKQAEESPELAAALAELPQTLPEIIRLAESKGFDPTHVRHFTNDQVKRVMFGSMRLGGGRGSIFEEAVSGTRKQRRATLLQSGRVNRSLEALTSAVAEVHNEVRTNNVIDWIENGVARNIEQGAEIPKGWVAWEPIRTGLLTDEVVSEATGRAVRTANRPTQIIPKAVEGTLRKYTKDYSHWFPQMLARVTNPWRALVLTMSPGWYVRNFIGNTILAVNAAGLDMAAWKAAWKDYRKRDEFGAFADLPFVGRGGTATDLDLDGSSLLPFDRGVAGIREAAQSRAGQGEILGRTRGALGEIQRRMLRANEVVDEFSRAYVYHHGKLKKGWTTEQAIEEANAALVDYGALSNWERQVVRAAIPFYSWQKGILKVVLKQGIDHPGRAAVLMHLGQMNEEYMADRLGMDREDIPNQMMHMIGGRDFRSMNPFADAGSLVSPAGIAASINPFVDIAVRKGLGAPEFFPESHRLSPFGTAEADVNVADELIGLGAGLPGARALGIRRPGQEDVDPVGTRVGSFLGMPREVDDKAVRSRLLKARKIIRDIDNPETGQKKAAFSFDPRGR